MTNTLISFIVTYHDEQPSAIRETVESIMRLSLQDKEREIIVMDDGSDDCPLKELADIQDEIVYLRHKNKGLTASRNAAMRIAEGAYLQFIAAGDSLIAPCYEHCLDIVRYKSPDVVLFNTTNNRNERQEVTKAKTQGPIDGSLWLKNNNLRSNVCSLVFKKDILFNLRFKSGLKNDDEAFVPQLILRAENLFYTEAKAYLSTKEKGKADSKKTERSLNELENIIYHLQDVAATQSHTNRKALERKVAFLTMDYLLKSAKAHNRKELEERVQRLAARNLFPLPARHYPLRYTPYRLLLNSKLGRMALAIL